MKAKTVLSSFAAVLTLMAVFAGVVVAQMVRVICGAPCRAENPPDKPSGDAVDTNPRVERQSRREAFSILASIVVACATARLLSLPTI